jgi:hypothetical protein
VRAVGVKPVEETQAHRITLHQHFAVGESQHVVPELLEFGRAPNVSVDAIRAEMLAPIEFDDQPRLDASKVGEIPSHRMLPPELEPAELPIA